MPDSVPVCSNCVYMCSKYSPGVCTACSDRVRCSYGVETLCEHCQHSGGFTFSGYTSPYFVAFALKTNA